jgi:hypothetical protein
MPAALRSTEAPVQDAPAAAEGDEA